MRCTVGLESPHLHLANPLAAELRLASHRLLRDQRVRADRARVDLVIHHVAQFQHVNDADCHVLLERMPCQAVVQLGLARLRQAGLGEVLLDPLLSKALKDRHRELDPQFLPRPAEMGLQDLAYIHARRHAKGIQHDFDRRPVRKERHVFFGQHACDHALVAVTIPHLVAYRELSLHGDKDLDGLDHARRQLFALLQLVLAFLNEVFKRLDLSRGIGLDPVDPLVLVRNELVEFQALQVPNLQLIEMMFAQNVACRDEGFLLFRCKVIGLDDPAAQQFLEPFRPPAKENAPRVLEIGFQLLDSLRLDCEIPVVRPDALAHKHLDAEHDPRDLGWAA